MTEAESVFDLLLRAIKVLYIYVSLLSSVLGFLKTFKSYVIYLSYQFIDLAINKKIFCEKVCWLDAALSLDCRYSKIPR